MATFSEEDFDDKPTLSEEDFAPEPSMMDTVLSSGGQGFTGGWQDEITGAIQAVPALLQGDTKQAGIDYRQYRDAMRADNERNAAANPRTAFAANLATSLPASVATGGVGGAMAMGGLQGLGSAQSGSIAKDLSSAAMDAGASGLAAGVVAPLAGAGAKWLGNKSDVISKYLANKRIPGKATPARGEYIRDELLGKTGLATDGQMAAKNAMNIEKAPMASNEWDLPELPIGKKLDVSDTVAGRSLTREPVTQLDMEKFMPTRKGIDAFDSKVPMMSKVGQEIENQPPANWMGEAISGGILGGGIVGAAAGVAAKAAKPFLTGMAAKTTGTVGKSLAKYNKVLQDAFARGGQRLVSSTEYLLNTRDPEYRELQRAKAEDKDNDD